MQRVIEIVAAAMILGGAYTIQELQISAAIQDKEIRYLEQRLDKLEARK